MTSDSRLGAGTAVPFERNTHQRRVIRTIFETADRPLSVDEVVAQARSSRQRVSLSTVYRFVRSLVDDGSLAAFELPGHGSFYELAGKAHHHHFACLRCKRVYELNDCISMEQLAIPKGFRAVSHDLTVNGFCAKCKSAPPRG